MYQVGLSIELTSSSASSNSFSASDIFELNSSLDLASSASASSIFFALSSNFFSAESSSA